MTTELKMVPTELTDCGLPPSESPGAPLAHRSGMQRFNRRVSGTLESARALLVPAFALVLAACNTPSIPLPPPELGALRFRAASSVQTVELVGTPNPHHAGVRFSAFNRSRLVGVLVEAGSDGSFVTQPFAGSAGDTVELWYERDGDRSESITCTEIGLGDPLDTTRCR